MNKRQAQRRLANAARNIASFPPIDVHPNNQISCHYCNCFAPALGPESDVMGEPSHHAPDCKWRLIADAYNDWVIAQVQ